ncbi:MAG: hypothetical protein FJX59_09730 [Alphaproteobacteria bacterium]|nr:hypothetical protein [Alphaproteobacteria bacterium]
MLRPRLGGPLGTYYRVEQPVHVPVSEANCPTLDPANGRYVCFDRFKYKAADPIVSSWTNLAPPVGNRCGQAPGNAALTGDVELLVFEKYSAAKMRLECVDTANRIVYLTGATGASSQFT